MRRALITVVLAPLIGMLPAAPASAHPLGNFSINHLTEVRISSDRVDLRYVLDEAEIPTFQERDAPVAELLARKRADVARGLAVIVDGRKLTPQFVGAGRISHPRGQGGLPLTRVELQLRATTGRIRSVRVHDGTYPNRVGWKAIVPQPGEGTAVRASAPAGDPTHGLRSYPQDALSSPLDERSATFSIRSGDGTLVAPRRDGRGQQTTRNRAGDDFAAAFADAAAGKGVLVLLLLAAFAWGALHALSPGHGKAMVAAYLAGTRGTARHAFALGATVTITHTIGVFALGLVTLFLSQYLLPEQLYPWLNVASGLLVVLIGAGVLRSRLRTYRARRAPSAHHHHHHHAQRPEQLSWRGLLGMGASAGLIPCPSALVVLLAAIAQHQLALGLLMIVVFSLGLAATLSMLGLLVVYAGRVSARLDFSGRLTAALPAISALVIVGAGCLLTARAVPELM